MELFTLVFLSAAFALSLYYFILQGRKNRYTARSWGFGITAIVLIPFGLAWAATSFGEGEPTAAYMGIFIFSGLGVVFGLLTLRSLKSGKDPSTGSAREGVQPSTTKAGVTIALIALIGLAAILLAPTLGLKRTTGMLDNQASVTQLIEQKVLSDEALPRVIKKTLAYETLYGEYPETLKERMMQSMFSGVSPAEMVSLFDQVLPEQDRLALLDQAASSVNGWLTSNEPYPQMTLEPGRYFSRLESDPEFVVRWIYKNFSLPPMADTTVAKFQAGEFSENFDQYMGTPPDSIKEMLVAPAARALQKQLSAIEVPAMIHLADQLKREVPAEAMLGHKSSVSRAFGAFAWLWLLPVFLIIATVAIVVMTRQPLVKWLVIILLCLGSVGSLMINPLRDIDATVHNLIETASGQAPAPALALLFYIAPVLMDHAGKLLMPLMNGLLISGLVLLAVAYASPIKAGVDTFKNRLAHGKRRKIETADSL